MSEIAEFTRHLGHYLPTPDIALVERAFEFSESAHRGQFRKSGEPYITHPLAVASILSEWRLDAEGLAAALLHDVMEDTAVSRSEIESRFGRPVAAMVDGLSKLDQIEFASREDAQAESFRKMLLAMARDVRVILIKLADRLHNMRTLDAMAPTHRKRIARETLDIYAPIANRLGLNALYLELQDLSFKHLYPLRYRILAQAIKTARGNRREVMNRLLDVIRDGFARANIAATVTGREKTIYSVYRKMREKHYTFSQVFDIYGVRVLVNDKSTCYAALGVLHEHYKPIPGKFKDYIAIPKANGYQSLHTTLFGPFGTPLEAQLRTHDMHRVAEAGVAAHWLYKSGGQLDLEEAQRETDRWLQSLLEIQSESRDSKEFLEHVKGDLFPDEIYLFTPKGKIMALPRGATAVDFAYGVHTDIGHHCVAARINYELLPLRTELKNGDHVEILTSPTARPNPSWLSFVTTGKARSRIRHYLKGLQQQESAALGERLLNQALATLKVEPESITWDRWEAMAKEYGAKSQLDILADIGLGKRLSFVVAQALTRAAGKTDETAAGPAPATSAKPGALTLRGVEGVAIQYARCCRPLPGDAIVGQFRRGQGLIVHIRDCVSLRKQRVDGGEIVDVEWATDVQGVFDAGVRVLVADRRGMLAELATTIGDADANIDTVSMERPDGGDVAMFFGVQVRDRRHLAHIMRALRRVPDVRRVQRART
ncbi:MAG: bifunctional (p)ppGpp synthetase/guanosine-3',5'-bis(diphosphate) 3'-pyrophosphohydrolase [Betaproteobacteria bacterium]|nr:bifunctional (p)ppGpp synthetase/guanosine-3',5'-bis(diphosphate) 3'-pyrophosphohydrolase [Betaproteobacteria bacterium]MDE2210526.1 bifunctional (p)ppGpp synthetase/guanosine-3',5'-bis(diphosphate) 3'-pyrophosphohydrolase [Betaproteobacteria bacterium]MDE2358373.1 bifunctional (p)ppGpp synthetase/guanosine-3',5'-bis(diphosphate) 3'-pyrophosphohydrolase [Betaproteobacteria bacterium]